MPSERYVALGLARVRTAWFSEVARWANSGQLAMDFVKTVSADEVRARLGAGRPFSILLVDGGVPGIDRDLIQLARERGCATIVVTDGGGRDWAGLGAAATIPTGFGRTELEGLLAEHASPVGRPDAVPGRISLPERHHPTFRARVVAVTGAGGTGRSTVAMALAQGFAAEPSHADTVVLADLALHADQGMLHDVRDVIPGVVELVEAHRGGTPGVHDVRSLTFDIVERRYRLLLGLRRHRDWTALRPRALRAALDGLRRTCTLVVADIDDDLEGETATGSADVEDRNLLARTTVELADVVVVVGTPGPKGAHSSLRVLRDCLDAGVDPHRIVLVVNRTPRGRAARTEVARAVHELLATSHPGRDLLGPVFLPERRHVDDALRDAVPLPAAVVEPVTAAVQHRLDSVSDRAGTPGDEEPQRVEPGSLGTWEQGVAG
jgi:MinD-like ATPase involved in chromosome partitioning or flagellar assembly